VYTARQAFDEDEEQFADRLTKNARDAGSVFSEDSLIAVERFDFEACLRMSGFQFTRGSALYRE
jgi:hypothetical protein